MKIDMTAEEKANFCEWLITKGIKIDVSDLLKKPEKLDPTGEKILEVLEKVEQNTAGLITEPNGGDPNGGDRNGLNEFLR